MFCGKRLGLSFSRRARGRVPDHPLAAASGEVHHVAGRRGAVTHFGVFQRLLAGSYGIENSARWKTVASGPAGLKFKEPSVRT